MIKFDHVTKKYGLDTYALDDIDVEIKSGEFVFLIGPSGAGKTTLLRLLLRDVVPSQGKVFVDDIEVQKLPIKKVHLLRRKVGMVFQDFKILSDRTVFENVAIGLEILGKSKETIKKEVTDILELMSLSDKHHQFPMQLSAGEMQRTGIARAIAGGPKIILADEPTGNLDPQTSSEILEILEQINKIGTTVIMATHNQNIVDEMEKRIICLERGKVVRDEEKGKYKKVEKRKKAKLRKKGTK
ncbi:cell division ATP-binding protein FtsE [Patescibacteria group bacterium]